MAEKTTTCGNCRAVNPADFTFCHFCKVPREDVAPPPAKTTKKTAAKKTAKKRR